MAGHLRCVHMQCWPGSSFVCFQYLDWPFLAFLHHKNVTMLSWFEPTYYGSHLNASPHSMGYSENSMRVADPPSRPPYNSGLYSPRPAATAYPCAICCGTDIRSSHFYYSAAENGGSRRRR